MRSNVLLRYSILMLFAVGVIITIVGIVLSRAVEDHIVRMHIGFYDEYIRSGFTSPLSNQSELDKFRQLPHIQEAFALDRSGKSISELPPDLQALVSQPETLAQVSTGVTATFELPMGMLIMVPLVDVMGRAGGYIGLVEADEVLKRDIGLVRLTIAVLVGTAGLILYLSLFGLFFGAYKEQLESAHNLRKTFDVVVFAMSSLSELRDVETGGHLERTAKYAEVLVSELRRQVKFRAVIDGSLHEAIVLTAPLHDIGKVGVADGILRKPGKLSQEEYEQMKQHTDMGAAVLKDAANKLPFKSSLSVALDITRHHHERWDGAGYPDRLAGTDIPLAARIVSISDVYDALRSSRPYKPGFDHDTAVRMIRESRGTQFDPELVDAFLTVESLFASVFESIKGDGDH